MTKVGIIGATGMAGSAIFKKGEKSDLDMVAIVRNANKARKILGDTVQILEKDAFHLTYEDLKDFDVIVNAFSTLPAQAYLHVDLTAHLISLFRETESPRLIFILGAGSLHTGADHHLVLEDIRNTPGSEAWIATPENQLAQLHFLQEVKNVNWVGISPGALFVEGHAVRNILYGIDELLINDQGKSETSSETMAEVVVKEIKDATHHQERFTVSNG